MPCLLYDSGNGLKIIATIFGDENIWGGLSSDVGKQQRQLASWSLITNSVLIIIVHLNDHQEVFLCLMCVYLWVCACLAYLKSLEAFLADKNLWMFICGCAFWVKLLEMDSQTTLTVFGHGHTRTYFGEVSPMKSQPQPAPKTCLLAPSNWLQTRRLIFMCVTSALPTFSTANVLLPTFTYVSPCPSAACRMTSLSFISMKKTILKVSCRDPLYDKSTLSSLTTTGEGCYTWVCCIDLHSSLVIKHECLIW